MNNVMQLNEIESTPIGETEGDSSAKLYKVRAALGIKSFGFSLLEIEANSESYEHDHKQDGQEELYFCLSGTGQVKIDDQDWQEIGTAMFVHVEPNSTRQFRAGERGLMLAICSGNPTETYEKVMPEWSELTKDTDTVEDSAAAKEGERQEERTQQ